jgi:acetyl-CoA C-acetyltransferase
MKTTNQKTAYNGKAIYVVDGLRTPFLKARGRPGPFTAADLAVACAKPLLQRQPFAPDAIQEVVVGCAMPSPDEANIARIIALRLGCGQKVPGWTVQRNCGSGMQAVDNAAHDIATGRYDLVLAGGVDAMSHAPLLYSEAMARWFAAFSQAKGYGAKFSQLLKFRPYFLAPIISLLRGLTDPIVGLSMGQTAENLAYQFNISRQEMDSFAVESHQRLLRAQEEQRLPEVTAIFDTKGNYYLQDDGVRADSTLEKLKQLKPMFDRKFGNVTAGNSSQVTDGAAMLLLASNEVVKRYKLPVLGRIVDVQWSALDPAVMGLGPAFSSAELMQRNKLQLSDIDYWEINEAFAAQVLACVKALDDKAFCQNQMGLSDKIGMIDPKRLNIHGGAICMGHPIGASGARLVLQLLHILRQQKAKRGIASLCIGGGQGGAMLLETTDVKESAKND